MAYVNAYIQVYTAIVLLIILTGNLMINYKSKELSERVFYSMLFFGVVMLVAGGIDNYTFIREAENRWKYLEPLLAGISDICYFLIISNFTLYLDSYARREGYRGSPLAVLSIIIGVIYGIFWFISDFTNSIYSQDAESITYGPLYYIGQIGGYLITIITIIVLVRRRNELKRGDVMAFVVFLAGPLLASLLRGYFPHITLMPVMVALTLVIIQIFVQGSRELIYREQQAELAEIRTDLLMSRMKPHFIYNVLNSIYVLCDKSVDEAKDAIAKFAQYLRSSLVDLDSSKLIPFEEELEHVKNYLDIEKIRFGDRLETKYDIETTCFMIPPLALQALVENSVKHGIQKKMEGGLITVSAKEEAGNIIVTVRDNGPGFDPGAVNVEEKKNDKRKHVGVYSSTYRLEHLCGGKLIFNSAPGEGTAAVITMPVDRVR